MLMSLSRKQQLSLHSSMEACLQEGCLIRVSFSPHCLISIDDSDLESKPDQKFSVQKFILSFNLEEYLFVLFFLYGKIISCTFQFVHWKIFLLKDAAFFIVASSSRQNKIKRFFFFDRLIKENDEALTHPICTAKKDFQSLLITLMPQNKTYTKHSNFIKNL